MNQFTPFCFLLEPSTTFWPGGHARMSYRYIKTLLRYFSLHSVNDLSLRHCIVWWLACHQCWDRRRHHHCDTEQRRRLLLIPLLLLNYYQSSWSAC